MRHYVFVGRHCEVHSEPVSRTRVLKFGSHQDSVHSEKAGE
jgi:hypothetical protein